MIVKKYLSQEDDNNHNDDDDIIKDMDISKNTIAGNAFFFIWILYLILTHTFQDP